MISPHMECPDRLLALHTQISLETITLKIRTRSMQMGMGEEDMVDCKELKIHMPRIRALSTETGEDMQELLLQDPCQEEAGLAEAMPKAQLKTSMDRVADTVLPRHKTATVQTATSLMNQLLHTMMQLVHTIVVNLNVNSPTMAGRFPLSQQDSILLIRRAP
jgi:hypothetical protein